MRYKYLLFSIFATTLINAAIPQTTNNTKLNRQKNSIEQNLTKLCLSLKCKINLKGIITTKDRQK